MIIPNETWGEHYVPGERQAHIPDRTMFESPEGDILLLFGDDLPQDGAMARRVCDTHDIWAVADLRGGYPKVARGHIIVTVGRGAAWRLLVDLSYD